MEAARRYLPSPTLPTPPEKADSPPTNAELRLIGHLREIGYGEATVKVRDGQPVHLIETQRSIPIPND